MEHKGIVVSIIVGTLLVFVLMALLALGHAGSLYLNPATGSDSNPGTVSAPWKTFNKVASSVGPGDVVNIQAGTYTPAQYATDGYWLIWGAQHGRGRAGQPITIQPAPGATVLFDGHGMGMALGFGPQVPTDLYIVVQGLEFRNYSLAIGTINANYVAVVGCTSRQTQSGVISTSFGHHLISQGNKIYDTSHHANYIAEGTEWFVHDRNYQETTGYYGFHGYGHLADGIPNTTLAHWIVRRNVYVNTAAHGMLVTGSSNIHHIYLYHNTVANDAGWRGVPGYGDGAGAVGFRLGAVYTGPVVVKNNLGAGYFSGAALEVSNGLATDGQLTLATNLWYNMRVPQVLNWAGSVSASVAAPSVSRDPRYGNLAGHDLTLQPGSPAIDAGTWLTTTRSSGSGTTLPVVDAGYFHDGYGLIGGDVVQLEGGASAQVTHVDYDANTLTLKTGLTWKSGQGVSLRYTGKAPDIGRYEVGLSDDDAPVFPAPTRLRVVPLGR